jgi:hypothetical protein
VLRAEWAKVPLAEGWMQSGGRETAGSKSRGQKKTRFGKQVIKRGGMITRAKDFDHSAGRLTG